MIKEFQWRNDSDVSTCRNNHVGNIRKATKETGYEDGRWIELAQNRVQWRALVLVALNIRVLLAVT
jgi:hypothetical protein